MDAKTAWGRVPRWARWPLAYVALLGLSWLVGTLTPLDVGAALFLSGAGAILAAAFLLRLGGPRMVVAERAPDGSVLRREPLPEEDREREMRLGLGLFLLGLALWAPVAVRAWL